MVEIEFLDDPNIPTPASLRPLIEGLREALAYHRREADALHDYLSRQRAETTKSASLALIAEHTEHARAIAAALGFLQRFLIIPGHATPPVGHG